MGRKPAEAGAPDYFSIISSSACMSNKMALFLHFLKFDGHSMVILQAAEGKVHARVKIRLVREAISDFKRGNIDFVTILSRKRVSGRFIDGVIHCIYGRIDESTLMWWGKCRGSYNGIILSLFHKSLDRLPIHAIIKWELNKY